MFTGLIQAVGRLEAREARGGDQRLRFAIGALPFEDATLGESIAVSGCCLTVVAFDERSFSADLSVETLACTTLGELSLGAAVNLERALRLSDRLGGHLVSGHVDAVGEVAAIVPDGRAQRWRFLAPPSVGRYVCAKGSICVDGVSLTVNATDPSGFEVALIPHTLEHTAFSQARVGQKVNLEADLLARYAERIMNSFSEK